VDNALSDWGTDAAVFPPAIRDAYIKALQDPAHIHAICEEFRAAYTIDYLHDIEDRKKANRMQCPVLALWSAGGPVDAWYATAGGPLAMWRNWALQVQGWPVKGGHFFPESAPAATAHALQAFFGSD
jgi:haloacetate dehalogenase